ncbi:MAG: hypothetical protein KJ042_17555 [Deltaproteobacteria bacterium]|nr:hypothetical protein [Deltaproteobacteria bacterium]
MKSAMRCVVVVAVLAVSLTLVGGSCGEGNSVYSAKCWDLSDKLNARIAELAAKRAACVESAECTWAAVVVPCNRDNVVDAAIAVEQVDAFRADIAALAGDKCSPGDIDDCNAHCGTEGSLVFPAASAACEDQKCVVVAGDDPVGASLPSAEICDPDEYVYLPADVGKRGR